MAQLVILVEDRILHRLKRRAWKQGLPLQDSLRVLFATTVEEDESDTACRDADSVDVARRLLSA